VTIARIGLKNSVGGVMTWLNRILRATRNALSRVVQTWRGKVGLGVIVFATLAIVAFLNPIRESDLPKAQTVKLYDQQISIPKIPGGEKSMSPLREEALDAGGQ
jgi:hypothetical protein